MGINDLIHAGAFGVDHAGRLVPVSPITPSINADALEERGKENDHEQPDLSSPAA